MRFVAALIVVVSCACSTPGAKQAHDVLTARVYIEADYDAVWERFTEAELYADWYSSPCKEFGQRPGDSVRWGTDERDVYRGQLVEIEKGSGLTHTFQFVGFGFDEPATPVTIGITDHGATVLVSIHHDCSGAPETYDIITPIGWPKSLSRLKTLQSW